MRSAPVGKKAEGKRSVQDLGSDIVIRDKGAKLSQSAVQPIPADQSDLKPVAVVGNDGTQFGGIVCDPSSTLASLRESMQTQLTLPQDWVFEIRAAPIGKKAEGKRVVGDLGATIVIRDKSAASAPKMNGEASSLQQINVATEGGVSLGSIRIATTDTLGVARRTIAETIRLPSLPSEYVFIRNSAPVGLKQEKKITVRECMPLLTIRAKATRSRSASIPASFSDQRPAALPAASQSVPTEDQMVPQVGTDSRARPRSIPSFTSTARHCSQ